MGRSGFVPQPDNLGLIGLGFILQPNLSLESTLNPIGFCAGLIVNPKSGIVNA